MKTINNRQNALFRLSALLLLLPLAPSLQAEKQGVWQKWEVKERMTDPALHMKKNPSFLFSAKSDDQGMNFEMSSVWATDKKRHVYRGHVAWEWTNQKGPGMLIPGEQVALKGIVTNLSGEPSSAISAYATFGTWGFMKPQSGKSHDASARFNGSTVMVGSFAVPKLPGRNRDGTPDLFLRLTLNLHGGSETSFIERTIIYKWIETQGETPPAAKPPAATPPAAKPIPPAAKPPAATPPSAASNGPQAWAEKAEYKAGEPIVVRFRNLPGFNADWIGVYGARAYHANEFIEWKRTNALKEGSMQFNSPRYGPGDYVFRIYENNGYKLLVQTAAFRVVP